MTKPAIKALKDYESQKNNNVKRYSFNPIALGIKNAHFWEERLKNNQKDSI